MSPYTAERLFMISRIRHRFSCCQYDHGIKGHGHTSINVPTFQNANSSFTFRLRVFVFDMVIAIIMVVNINKDGYYLFVKGQGQIFLKPAYHLKREFLFHVLMKGIHNWYNDRL